MKKLSSLLNPMSSQQFLESYWGKDYLRIEGETDKFSSIVTWEDLNNLLSYAPLRNPQIRLLKDGEEVRPDKYINFATTRFKTAPLKQSVVPQNIQTFLKDGATLVINGLHTMLPKVHDLAVQLERELGDTVRINGYLGWNGARGFSKHWDDHDVIVIQIFGEKQWYLYDMTRKHPLMLDSNPGAVPEETNWEGRITSGDMLYLPRGYWHAAESVDGPTFHLTIGISRKTGIDFLHWLVDQLVEQESVRKDLPRLEWSSQDQVISAGTDLVQRLLAFAGGENLLSQYLKYDASNRKVLAAASMPFAVQGSIDNDTTVISNLARRLVVEDNTEDTIIVSGAGKSLTLPKLALPILEQSVYSG